jgi:hypothetical protein
MLSVQLLARKLVGSWTRPIFRVPPLTAFGSLVSSAVALPPPPELLLELLPHAATVITATPSAPAMRCLVDRIFMHTS